MLGDLQATVAGLEQGESVPESALRAAELASQGDLQAALGLAQAALECQSPSLRVALCGLIDGIEHPAATQVALLYLMGELSKRPQALKLVLSQVASPEWVPVEPAREGASELDPATFAKAERADRCAILKRLVQNDQLPEALKLPLDGDDFYDLWPALQQQPELLQPHLLKLPLSLLWQVVPAPRDTDLLGWLSPARSASLGPQTVAFERYPSATPYYDGGDGTMETPAWRVRVEESGCQIRDSQGQPVMEVHFDNARDDQDYSRMAEHDRFFEGLSGGRHQANKACSLSMACDDRLLAVATLDGAVTLYDLPGRTRQLSVFPAGKVSEQAQPVRLRWCSPGPWLAGVHEGHYFVWDGEKTEVLGPVPAGLRGLFFKDGQLWSICRDGSVYRLNPQTCELHQELEAGGLLPALSPDQRCLASYRHGRVELYLLQPTQLGFLSGWEAPTPVRLHFAEEGRAVVLRLADPGKSPTRSALSELSWRMGHACVAQWDESERTRLLELGGEVGGFFEALFTP